MVEEQLISLSVNLLATGIASGTGVGREKVRQFTRSRTVSEDLDDVATEFNVALQEAIEEVDAERESRVLADVTDDWPAIAEELAGPEGSGKDSRTAEQLEFLFESEAEAVSSIAEAYAAVEGFDLDETGLRPPLESALTDAYRRAVAEFQREIASSEALAREFQSETGLVLSERLAEVERRLDCLAGDFDRLLSKAARNEGFRRLSPRFFERQSPSPETCWRVGFSLADVEAGIPAERRGLEEDSASRELLELLRTGESRIVVGRRGSGKSTLCKQVAVRWYGSESLGEVLYRERRPSKRFESTDDLKHAIERADGPVLVVVEDAMRTQASAVFETIEEFEAVDDVSFLLDTRREELDNFEGAGSIGLTTHRRYSAIADDIPRYSMPALSVEDVDRVREAFEAATGRAVPREAESLHADLKPDTESGVGDMLMLAFFLPAAGDERTPDGLEAHVRTRFEALANPEREGSSRDLTEFDLELLADVGAMVNLLNASGIGVYQELVHALGYEHGHDITTHDQIESVLGALEGWFLFRTDAAGPGWTTHELWSTLYLRELAQRHRERRSSSRRRGRSEPHVGRCLESLFRLFDDESHREALVREFPNSDVIDDVASRPDDRSAEYLESIFGLCKQWPVLVSLFGTERSARYTLPEPCSRETKWHVARKRGDAHRSWGNPLEARREYETVLEAAKGRGATRQTAKSLNDLGMVSLDQGEFVEAMERFERSLTLFEEEGEGLEAAWVTNNIGIVARKRGDLDRAIEAHQQALEQFREADSRAGESNCLTNLGLVHMNYSNFDESIGYHEAALELFEGLNSRHGQARCYNNLGVVAEERGDLKSATASYEQSLEIFRKVGDRQRQTVVYDNLGVVARKRGDLDEAEEYVRRSLELAEELEDRYNVAWAYKNLGSVERKRGNLQEAEQFHIRSLEKFREIEDKHGCAECLDDLGVTNRKLGDIDAARDYHKRSLSLYEEIGDRQGQAEALNNLGLIARQSGNFEEAAAKHRTALEMFSDIGDRQGRAGSYNNLGVVEEEQGFYEKAIEDYRRSLELFEAIGDRHRRIVILDNIGVVARKQGDLDRAERYHERSYQLAREVDDSYNQAWCRRNLGLIARERSEHPEARDHLTEAFELFERSGARDDTVDVIEELVAVCSEMGEPDAAREWCTRGAERAAEFGLSERETEFHERRRTLENSDGGSG